MSNQANPRGLRTGLTLDYPMSLGVYDSYDDAQKAVDYLSDHEFPVQDLLIVGTDLKQLERVTGRLTRGRVIGRRAAVRRLAGLFVGHHLLAVRPTGNVAGVIVATMPSEPCSASSGRSSATGHPRRAARLHLGQPWSSPRSYEVLVEHKHAAARPRAARRRPVEPLDQPLASPDALPHP